MAGKNYILERTCTVCGKVFVGGRGAKFCPECREKRNAPKNIWLCKVCGKRLKCKGYICPECRKKRAEAHNQTCVLCGGHTQGMDSVLCPACRLKINGGSIARPRKPAPEPKHQPKPKFSLQDMLFFTDYYSKKFGERISYGKLQVMIDRGEVHPERIRRGKDAVCVPRVRQAL